MVVGPIVIFIAAGMGAYLGSYLRRKGENLATRGDADAITRAVEGVKHEMAERAQVHRLTSEREFQILSDLYAALAELTLATQELRPELDTIDPAQPAEDRKRARLGKFAAAWNNAVDVIFKNEPFYPHEIQVAARGVMEAATREGAAYKWRAPSTDEPGYDPEYWENRAKNIAEINKRVRGVCDAIRRHYADDVASATSRAPDSAV